MFVDPQMIAGNIAEAYDVFAGMGFEKKIHIEDYDLDSGEKEDHTVYGLQLNKDTIKVGKEYQFLTEAHPSIYVRKDKLVDDQGNPLIPDHSQIIYQEINPGKKYSVYSINEIFNMYIVRLKP